MNAPRCRASSARHVPTTSAVHHFRRDDTSTCSRSRRAGPLRVPEHWASPCWSARRRSRRPQLGRTLACASAPRSPDQFRCGGRGRAITGSCSTLVLVRHRHPVVHVRPSQLPSPVIRSHPVARHWPPVGTSIAARSDAAAPMGARRLRPRSRSRSALDAKWIVVGAASRDVVDVASFRSGDDVSRRRDAQRGPSVDSADREDLPCRGLTVSRPSPSAAFVSRLTSAVAS